MDLQEQLRKGKEQVAFRLRFLNQYGSTSHIEIDLCYVSENNAIAFYDNYTGQKHQYRNLVIKSQMDDYFFEPYGYNLVTDCTSGFCLDEAKLEVKVLTSIDRKLKLLCKEKGYPNNFVEYVSYMANVFGVQAFYVSHLNSRNVYHEGIEDLATEIIKLIDYHRENIAKAA